MRPRLNIAAVESGHQPRGFYCAQSLAVRAALDTEPT